MIQWYYTKDLLQAGKASVSGADSGRPAFLQTAPDEGGMSEREPVADAITPEELNEMIADETDETAEEIEEGAAEIDIGPRWEGEHVDK